jgi:hypothetical protein
MAEAASHREKIAGRVNSGLESLTEQASFKDLLTSSTPAEGDLVLVNNSFIYRDTVKTTKSPKYIAGRLSKDGTVSSWGIVAWDHPLNVDFKHLSVRSGNLPAVVDLDDAVNDELPTVGSVVFSLIGSVGERPPTEVSLSAIFEVLRYDSTAVNQVARDGNALVINTLADPEGLWADVDELVRSEGASDNDVARLASQFGKALDDLREQTPRLIHLNAGSQGPLGGSLLGQIASHMESQLNEYERALKTLGRDSSDRDAYNNILRISYNFASDAIDLVTLFVSICDLKPLVQWLTIAENFALAEAFRRLPFGVASTRKPSLKAYADVVGGARNHAFHDFFAFDRPFEVDLSGVTLRARRLLLFHAHRRAPEDAFDYEDRELVEVLRSFSRAPERSVSMDFWRRNFDVLKSAHRLTVGIGEALQLLWNAMAA